MKTTGRPLLITVETERLPLWLRLRDGLLTLLLWLVCTGMWLQLFPEFKRWLATRAEKGLDFELPSIVTLLREGTIITEVLLVAYLSWSLWTWRRSNADLGLPAPPPLPPDLEASGYGLTADELPALRAHASVTVLTGPDGRIESWTPGFVPKRPD